MSNKKQTTGSVKVLTRDKQIDKYLTLALAEEKTMCKEMLEELQTLMEQIAEVCPDALNQLRINVVQARIYEARFPFHVTRKLYSLVSSTCFAYARQKNDEYTSPVQTDRIARMRKLGEEAKERDRYLSMRELGN